jgi:hypothetical protein
VFHWSKGNPRLINIICDQSLLSGYSAGIETIGPQVVDDSIGSTLIPILSAEETEAAITTEPPGAEAVAPSEEPIAPRRPASRTAYWVPAAVGLLLGGLGVYWYTGVSRIDPAASVPALAGAADAEVQRMQGQLTDLTREKADADERVKEYEEKLKILEKEQQEGSVARARIAELETGMAARTQDMTALDHKLKELETALSVEKDGKGRLDAEIAARDAAAAELRQRFESALASQEEFRAANARLAEELKQAKASGERTAQLEGAVAEREGAGKGALPGADLPRRARGRALVARSGGAGAQPDHRPAEGQPGPSRSRRPGPDAVRSPAPTGPAGPGRRTRCRTGAAGHRARPGRRHRLRPSQESPVTAGRRVSAGGAARPEPPAPVVKSLSTATVPPRVSPPTGRLRLTPGRRPKYG